MSLLIRTWNLFHGNAKPPERRAFLEEMVRLVTHDRPDVVCLQEVPVWALPYLGRWSGMTAVGDVAAPPTLGPFPSTPRIGRATTRLHHGVLRSAFSGQANAILLAPSLRTAGRERLVLNPRWFRRAQTRLLSLGPLARLAWAAERRVCQVVRVLRERQSPLVVANLHATSFPPDQRLADAELLRAAVFVDAYAEPEEPLVVGGDFNVPLRRSWTVRELKGWGWLGGTPLGIDHVLARGLDVSAAVRWNDERRRIDGRLLSDHTPVEVRAA